MGPDLSKLAYNQRATQMVTRGSLHHWFLFLRHSTFCPFNGKTHGYTKLMDQGEESLFFFLRPRQQNLRLKRKLDDGEERRSHISSFCLKVTIEHSHHMSALNEVVQLSISHLSFFLYLFSSSQWIVPTFQGSSFLSPSPPRPPKQRPPTWWYISTPALMKRVSLAHT